MNIRLKTALQLGTLFTLILAIAVSVTLAIAFLHGVESAGWNSAFLVAVILGILALLMAGVLYLVGTALGDRLRALEDTARRVHAGDLNERTNLGGRDELSDIAQVFDEMTTSLKSYVQLIPEHETLRVELAKAREVVDTLRHRNMEISDSLQRLRRAQEQVTQKDRGSVPSGMFAAVSDDLVATLGTIREAAQRALAGGLGDEARALELAAIRTAAAEAQAKWERFAALCKKPSNGELEKLDLRELVDRAIALMEPKWNIEAARKGAVIRIDNQVPGGLWVQGAPSDLVQLFTHLLLNSIEAMPSGGVISFAAQAREDAVTITVGDNGLGMSEAAVKHCFLPFFSTKEDAAGIGLTIAQGIALQHGGKIGLASHVGVGTTVYVELPLFAARAVPPTQPATAASEPPLSILLVEDDRWTREAIVRNLQDAQHRVDSSANGADAMEKLSQGAYDAVITDRAMPDISGEEIAMEAKRLRPDVPVVLLTGFGALMHERGVKPPHVDRVLGKPIHFDDLRRVLAELAGPRRAGR
jgi:signal transduction histidine kinase/ActR/RegA family two-component response regulator